MRRPPPDDREVPRGRLVIGRKRPYALRVTVEYETSWSGSRTWARVYRYATERARDDAARAYGQASRRRPWKSVTVEKVDG